MRGLMSNMKYLTMVTHAHITHHAISVDGHIILKIKNVRHVEEKIFLSIGGIINHEQIKEIENKYS